MNKELMWQVMDEILAHPEKHDQRDWAKRRDCGTTLCFAGLACVMSGYEPNFTPWGSGRGSIKETAYLTTGELISAKATQLLGLSVEQADRLFYGVHLDAAGLKELVTELTSSE